MLLAALSAQGRTRVTEPAPSRDHTERMLRAFGVRGAAARAQRSRSRAARRCAARTSRCPATSPRRRSSWWPAAWPPSGRWCSPTSGINPTRTGLLEMLQRMGADIRLHQRAPPAGDDGEPVADIEVRRSAPARHHRAARRWCRWRSMNSRSSSSPPPARSGETRGARRRGTARQGERPAGGHGRRTQRARHRAPAAPRWPVAARRPTAWAAARIDSHGDHRIAMAFAIAALRARAPIEILDVANVATSFPGFVELARRLACRLNLSDGRCGR